MNRPGAPPSQLNPDAAVRSTDTDALVSRASASSLGYLSDPFASLFLPPALRRSTEKRPPLINIGTHARTWAVDALVEQFLLGGEGEDASSSGSKRQVLSLGAGTDTRYWRFRERFEKEGKEWRCRTWVEVDFEEATSGKARTVSGKAVLKDKLGGEYKTGEFGHLGSGCGVLESLTLLSAAFTEKGGTALNSPLYTLLPGDLRTFSTDLGPFLTSSDPFPTSSDPILDPTIPTLLLAECVLIYLPPTSTNSILSWFSQTFPSGSATVSYDPFGLNDSFGKVMLRNLAVSLHKLLAFHFFSC